MHFKGGGLGGSFGEISPFQVCGSRLRIGGKKRHGFVKMGDVEKGLKKKGEERNKLERQETDTSAEVVQLLQ